MEENKDLRVGTQSKTKLYGLIALIAVVLVAGFFIVKNLGKPKVVDHNQQIINALVDINQQHQLSNNEFFAPLGLKEINEKALNGQVSLSGVAVISKEALSLPQDLSLGFMTSMDQSKKQALLSLDAKFKDQTFIQGRFVIDKDNLIVDVPALFDKALIANLKTLGADLSTSKLLEGTDASQLEPIKDLSLDIWKAPTSVKESIDSLLKAVDPEIKAFKNKIDFIALEDRLVKVNDKEVTLKQYETLIPKEEVIALLKAFQKQTLALNQDKISGVKVEEQLPTQEVDGWVQSFEENWAKFEEPVKLIVGMDDQKVRWIEFNNSYEGRKIHFNLSLLGDKYLTQEVVLNFGPSSNEAQGYLSFKNSQEGDTNVDLITGKSYDGEMIPEIKVSFNTTTHELLLNSEKTTITAQFEDVVKGESFVLTLKDVVVNGQSLMNELKSLQLKVDKPLEVAVPTTTMEVLKMSQEEAQSFMMQSMIKLMMLAGQLGLNVPF